MRAERGRISWNRGDGGRRGRGRGWNEWLSELHVRQVSDAVVGRDDGSRGYWVREAVREGYEVGGHGRNSQRAPRDREALASTKAN